MEEEDYISMLDEICELNLGEHREELMIEAMEYAENLIGEPEEHADSVVGCMLDYLRGAERMFLLMNQKKTNNYYTIQKSRKRKHR